MGNSALTNKIKETKQLMKNTDFKKQDAEGNTDFNKLHDGNTYFMQAVNENNYEAIKKLLKYKTEYGYDIGINQGNQQGTTPLIDTIKKWAEFKDYDSDWVNNHKKVDSYFEFVQLLIENGADVNKADNEGMTPLMAAVKFGKEKGNKTSIDEKKMIKYLIEHGADVNKADNEGKLPLDWANEYGRSDIITFILDPKKNVKTGGKRKSNKRKTNKKKKSNKRK